MTFIFTKNLANKTRLCLKLLGDFESSSKSLVIKIPAAVQENIRQTAAVNCDLVDKIGAEALKQIRSAEI